MADKDEEQLERQALLEMNEEGHSGERAAPSSIEDINPDDNNDEITPVDSQNTRSVNNNNSNRNNNDDDDEYEDESIEYQAEMVITVMKPVSITMIFVVWAVKTVTINSGGSAGVTRLVYQESSDDSTGTKLFGSLLNALIFLAAILFTTVAFVLLYKYRCLKIIYGWLITSSLLMLGAFGGTFFYLLLDAYNLPLDYITYVFLLWNFSVVGILAIFWHGPTKVNQGYLILISGLLAIFFTRMPEWTTFAILAIVAIYDIFAVLCPRGPLKVLVETAQERKEPIPALLYNASAWLMMADTDQPAPPPPEPERRKGIKLGLGDFVFYSVLIGRAALFDMITVFTCFIAIITGLFFTLLLLAIWRKALPALPISIGFGLLFYFLTRVFLLPFAIQLGGAQIFV